MMTQAVRIRAWKYIYALNKTRSAWLFCYMLQQYPAYWAQIARGALPLSESYPVLRYQLCFPSVVSLNSTSQ